MFERRMRVILGALACLWLLFLARVFWLQTSGAEEARRAVEGRLSSTTRLTPRRGSIVDADGLVLSRDDLDYDLTADAWGLGTTEWECEGCGRVVRTYEAGPGDEGTGAAPPPLERPGVCRAPACAGADRWVPTYAADRLALAHLLGKTEEEFAADLARVRVLAWADARRSVAGRESRLRRQIERDRLSEARPLARNVGPAAAMEVFLNPERYPGIRAEAQARRVTADLLDPATLRILGTTGPLQEDELAARGRELEGEGLTGSLIQRIQFGRSGLERNFDRDLRGSFGREVRQRDIYGRPTSHEVVEPARDGADLRVTFSADLNAVADRALAGRPGAVVALDPRTGAVLAIAGTSGDDPLPAITGHFPGSVLKTFTALVAEENGVAPAEGDVDCRGENSRPTRCEHVHGRLGLVEALGESCNAYFGEAGIRIGVRPFRDWARRLHIDEPFGLGLPMEGGGTEWTQTRFKAPWQKTDLSNLGIGQGKVVLSPLQVAALYAAAANGGRPVKPFLVQGRGQAPEAPIFSAATLDRVRRGLEATVNTGTAKDAGLARFRVAGKTGTAQIPNRKGRWNAWFAGYAPADNPRIVVVAVLLDIPEYGGHAAAPVVREFLDAWSDRESAGR